MYRQDERRSDSNWPCRVDTNALTHNLLAVSLHLKSFVNRQSDSCSAEFHFESSVRACANTEEQNKGRCVKPGWAGNGWISWLPYSSKHDEMGLTRPANTDTTTTLDTLYTFSQTQFAFLGKQWTADLELSYVFTGFGWEMTYILAVILREYSFQYNEGHLGLRFWNVKCHNSPYSSFQWRLKLKLAMSKLL